MDLGLCQTPIPGFSCCHHGAAKPGLWREDYEFPGLPKAKVQQGQEKRDDPYLDPPVGVSWLDYPYRLPDRARLGGSWYSTMWCGHV